MIKEELKNLDLSPKALRKFGITMAVVAGLVTLWLYFVNPDYIIFSGGLTLLFALLALVVPGSLKTFYLLWMALAFVLGFIMTRVILTVLFYLILTPTGLFLRLTGKDLLKLKVKGGEVTYWEKRPGLKKSQSDYEKQF